MAEGAPGSEADRTHQQHSAQSKHGKDGVIARARGPEPLDERHRMEVQQNPGGQDGQGQPGHRRPGAHEQVFAILQLLAGQRQQPEQPVARQHKIMGRGQVPLAVERSEQIEQGRAPEWRKCQQRTTQHRED